MANKSALSRNDLRGASIIINDAHNYDRIRYLYERMLGDNLNLRFSLQPINGMSGLAFATYGDGLHICGLSENRHWFADRADVALFEELDGKPFGMPTSLTYSADASDWVREGAAIVLECMEACSTGERPCELSASRMRSKREASRRLLRQARRITSSRNVVINSPVYYDILDHMGGRLTPFITTSRTTRALRR